MSLNLLEQWQRDNHPTETDRALKAIRLRSLYETLAVHLFNQYEPTKLASSRVGREFLLKIESWLEGFQDAEDKWTAFKSIEYLFFAGTAEFEELYRCAFHHNILPWLIDQNNIDIFSSNCDETINDELSKCWICPVTDSLRINGFLHLTGAPGQSLRPDWLSLRQFSDPNKIKEYIKSKNIKYLILLEDFVGSGGQMSRVLKFASTVFDGPILMVPLIICAPGQKKVYEVINEIDRDDVYYKPVLVIDEDCLVGPTISSNEPILFKDLRRVLRNGYDQIGCELDGKEFGWNNVGSLAVLYSNCPNNTPPIYHHATSSWIPLFPRIIREIK